MKIFGFPCSGPQASVVTLGKLITTSHISMSANACSKVLILFLISMKQKGDSCIVIIVIIIIVIMVGMFYDDYLSPEVSLFLL